MASFGLTTSQFVTAPKRTQGQTVIKVCLTTSQFVTAPKRGQEEAHASEEFDYQSVCHCSKTVGAKSSLQEDGQADWRASS